MKKNLLIILIMIACSASNVHAQWQQSGISGRQVNSLAVSGTDIFAGCDSSVYRSVDNGLNWTPVNTGLAGDSGAFSLVAGGGLIFALGNDFSFGPASGTYVSVNNGASWTHTSGGPDSPFRLVIRGNSIYGISGSNGGVVGASTTVPSWSLISGGLPIDCRFAFGGAGDGIFVLQDGGGSCLTPWGVVYKKTSTSSWTTSTGLVFSPGTPLPWAMVSSGTKIFAGANGANAVLMSRDTGTTWTSIGTGLPGDLVTALASTGTTLIAGHAGAGIYVSSDTGNTWTAANTGLGSLPIDVRSLVIKGTDVFAGTVSGGVWKRSLSNILTSVEEAKADYHFEVYPNPAKDRFTLSMKTPSEQNLKINITDMMGEAVYSAVYEKVNGNFSKEIKLENAASGIYFLQMISGKNTFSKKILISR